MDRGDRGEGTEGRGCSHESRRERDLNDKVRMGMCIAIRVINTLVLYRPTIIRA